MGWSDIQPLTSALPVFLSPLPNPQLWHGSSIGFLQTNDSFATGGWWHDPNILAATGKGMEIEEPRKWEGWWNEQIVWLLSYVTSPRLIS